MFKELRTRYKNSLEDLDIIDDLESMYQTFSNFPTGFTIGNHNSKLTEHILSEMGYVAQSERIETNGSFSLHLFVLEKKVSKEEWHRVANQYQNYRQTLFIIDTLKEIQKEYNAIPRSFYIDYRINVELLTTLLFEVGYIVVDTKQCIPATSKTRTPAILVFTSKKSLSL